MDHLSLEVRPGDVFGFIGHNGAGKTTTIRAITGVMDFSEGNIWVDGESVRENPLACKRKIAFVPDNPDLYDYLTGIQYLNFVADIFGMDASARESQIRRYAEMFEMTGALGDLGSHALDLVRFVTGEEYTKLSSLTKLLDMFEGPLEVWCDLSCPLSQEAELMNRMFVRGDFKAEGLLYINEFL